MTLQGQRWCFTLGTTHKYKVTYDYINVYISVIDTHCFIHNSESQIKCVATGDHAYAFWDGFENRRGHGEVIVVLKMWTGLYNRSIFGKVFISFTDYSYIQIPRATAIIGIR